MFNIHAIGVFTFNTFANVLSSFFLYSFVFLSFLCGGRIVARDWAFPLLSSIIIKSYPLQYSLQRRKRNELRGCARDPQKKGKENYAFEIIIFILRPQIPRVICGLCQKGTRRSIKESLIDGYEFNCERAKA